MSKVTKVSQWKIGQVTKRLEGLQIIASTAAFVATLPKLRGERISISMTGRNGRNEHSTLKKNLKRDRGSVGPNRDDNLKTVGSSPGPGVYIHFLASIPFFGKTEKA